MTIKLDTERPGCVLANPEPWCNTHARPVRLCGRMAQATAENLEYQVQGMSDHKMDEINAEIRKQHNESRVCQRGVDGSEFADCKLGNHSECVFQFPDLAMPDTLLTCGCEHHRVSPAEPTAANEAAAIQLLDPFGVVYDHDLAHNAPPIEDGTHEYAPTSDNLCAICDLPESAPVHKVSEDAHIFAGLVPPDSQPPARVWIGYDRDGGAQFWELREDQVRLFSDIATEYAHLEPIRKALEACEAERCSDYYTVSTDGWDALVALVKESK